MTDVGGFERWKLERGEFGECVGGGKGFGIVWAVDVWMGDLGTDGMG